MFQITVKLYISWSRCAHLFDGPVDNIRYGVDGILGLMPTLVSLPSQLSLKGLIHQVIGLCLTRYSHEAKPREIGFLSFGDDVIQGHHKWTWIHMLKDDTATGYVVLLSQNEMLFKFITNYNWGCD